MAVNGSNTYIPEEPDLTALERLSLRMDESLTESERRPNSWLKRRLEAVDLDVIRNHPQRNHGAVKQLFEAATGSPTFYFIGKAAVGM